MAWNDLANNRAVAPINLQGSPISRRDGQPHSSDQKALTRAKANQQLMIQILPNDNKLVLKQELVALNLYVASGSWGYANDSTTDPCTMPMNGAGSLYTSDPSGVITPYSYIAYNDGTSFHELSVVGRIVWFQNGQKKWADIEVAQIIGNINDCVSGKPTVFIGVISAQGRNLRVGSSRPLTSTVTTQTTIAFQGGATQILNVILENGILNKDFTTQFNLDPQGGFVVNIVEPNEDANYKYVGVAGVGAFPVEELS